jgi:hypothetical protein
MLYVMDSFKSSVLAAETMISFCNLLGVIQFAFDRKTKNPIVDADPGPSKPQLRVVENWAATLDQTIECRMLSSATSKLFAVIGWTKLLSPAMDEYCLYSPNAVGVRGSIDRATLQERVAT